MISYIEGKIIFKGNGFIIIKAGNIGFKVFTLPKLGTSGGEVKLFTHLHVREDAMVLYGFSRYEELDLFEILLSVSGIGPKAGIGILSLADPSTIKAAITKEDPSILTKVSGIGKKTAERVILELRNKFSYIDKEKLDEKAKEIEGWSDAIEALISLGYSSHEAKKAISKIPSEVKDVAEKVKMALKELGKK